MSRQTVKWGEPTIKAQLIEMVEGAPSPAEGYNRAAAHFHVSYNAVYQAYRYVKGVYVKPKKKKAKKARNPRGAYKTKGESKHSFVNFLNSQDSKKNPFAIMTDMEHSGNRATNAETIMLKDQIMKLPVGDLRVSVNIPATICKTRANAQNLAQNVRNILAGKSSTKNIVIVTRGVNDAKGVYVGTRVWRIK